MDIKQRKTAFKDWLAGDFLNFSLQEVIAALWYAWSQIVATSHNREEPQAFLTRISYYTYWTLDNHRRSCKTVLFDFLLDLMDFHRKEKVHVTD